MSKARVILAVAVLVVGVVLFWHQRTMARLEKERAELMEQVAQLTAAQEQNAKPQVDPAELARLRADQAELLRLRNEAAQLQRQIKENAAKASALAQAPATNHAQAEIPMPPVDTFAASNVVTMAWKQTLVTGGWSTESGKRTLFFTQPESIPSADGQKVQVLLKVQVLEIPDEVLAQSGLGALKSESKENSPQAVFTPEQAERLLKELEKTEGVKIVSKPRIQTSDGVEAHLHVGSALTLPSGETYPLGISVGVVPQLAPDGASVQLTVSSQFSKAKQ